MISVVIPVFNEGEGVKNAYFAIRDVMRAELPDEKYEIIFVDDGSHDDSFEYIAALCAEDKNIRGIKLSTNCGAHTAIRAGLEHARGDVACFLACDLQDPPHLIPKMLDRLEGRVQIVAAARNRRKDPWLSRLFSMAFQNLARTMVSRNLPPGGASMFMLGPKALKAIKKFGERNLSLEGLFVTMGFAQATVNYDRQVRRQGTSKWTLTKRLKLFADFFVAYSYTPIRLMSYLGMGVAFIGFLYALVLIINKLIFAVPVAGWTTLMVVVLVIGGIQMVMIGIIGEYLWRTLDEARGRPRYIIEEFLNIDSE